MSANSSSKRRSQAQKLRYLLRRERDLWEEGFSRVAGVDEAGMGPLAGPVVAAAVIFPRGKGLPGVHDSKRLTAARRTALETTIRSEALAWAVVRVEPLEIDAMNIYQAGIEAMRRALAALDPLPDYVLVDGRPVHGLETPHEAIVGGDARCHAIAAASILAKTSRDALMERYEEEYPGYGFASHKGYPTQEHRDAIRRLGPCPIHRRSFTLLPQPRLFD